VNRIVRPMHRYGDAEFDQDYLRWGFHDRPTQLKEAESVLKIAAGRTPLKILDLACGIGTHALCWARHGHAVTGVDISATFIAQANAAARDENIAASFVVADIRTLPYRHCFDLVCWIENSFFDAQMAAAIRGCLVPGGQFIMDVRNPDHERTRQRSSNWRTWREENGVYHLERHETDPATGLHEDVWITIDTVSGQIKEESSGKTRPLTLSDKIGLLKAAGFPDVQLRTMDGDIFQGGAEPYWLWLVAQ